MEKDKKNLIIMISIFGFILAGFYFCMKSSVNDQVKEMYIKLEKQRIKKAKLINKYQQQIQNNNHQDDEQEEAPEEDNQKEYYENPQEIENQEDNNEFDMDSFVDPLK